MVETSGPALDTNERQGSMAVVLLRMFAMIIQIINSVLWMRRSSFSRVAHIYHYIITVTMLILQLPLFDSQSMMQECARYLYSATILAMIATFAWAAALTTMHFAITVTLSVLIQVPFLMHLSESELALYDIFVSLNSVFVALAIFIAFSFLKIRRESDKNYFLNQLLAKQKKLDEKNHEKKDSKSNKQLQQAQL